MRALLPLSAAALFAASASAQLTTGRISDNNVVLATTALPTTVTSATALFQDLRVTGAAGTDQLYGSHWFWRLSTDPQEYAFHNGAAQGPRSSIYAGNSVVHSWADVDSRGFAATLIATAYSTGPTSGSTIQKLTFTNNTAAPVMVNLFAYVDYDQCGAGGDSAVANPIGSKISVTDAGACSVGEAFCPGADNFEVTSFATVRGKLTNAAPDDLNNTGIPFGPGDFTGAWQWKDRPVAPGASFTAYLILGQDAVHSGCVGPAGAQTYGSGKAGTNGVPSFNTNVLPFLGSVANLTVDNGLAGATPFYVLGSSQANLAFPPFGTILVNVAGAALFNGAPFDAANKSVTPLQIPNATQLCNSSVFIQAFIGDPAAAGFVSHTNGMAWTLGGVN